MEAGEHGEVVRELGGEKRRRWKKDETIFTTLRLAETRAWPQAGEQGRCRRRAEVRAEVAVGVRGWGRKRCSHRCLYQKKLRLIWPTCARVQQVQACLKCSGSLGGGAARREENKRRLRHSVQSGSNHHRHRFLSPSTRPSAPAVSIQVWTQADTRNTHAHTHYGEPEDWVCTDSKVKMQERLCFPVT